MADIGPDRVLHVMERAVVPLRVAGVPTERLRGREGGGGKEEQGGEGEEKG